MRTPIDAAKAATDAFLAMLAAFSQPAPTNRAGRRAQARSGPHTPGWNHRNMQAATTPVRPTDAELHQRRIATERNAR